MRIRNQERYLLHYKLNLLHFQKKIICWIGKPVSNVKWLKLEKFRKKILLIILLKEIIREVCFYFFINRSENDICVRNREQKYWCLKGSEPLTIKICLAFYLLIFPNFIPKCIPSQDLPSALSRCPRKHRHDALPISLIHSPSQPPLLIRQGLITNKNK